MTGKGPTYDPRNEFIHIDLFQAQELLQTMLKGRKLASLELLAGGFSNSNYRFSMAGHCRYFHLRLPQGKLADFKKEIAILEKVKAKLPVAVPLHWRFQGNQPFAVLEFIHGQRLDEVLGTLTSADQTALGRNLGRNLARIHQVNLGAAGFFDDHLAFSQPLPHFGRAWLEFTKTSLARRRVKRRMGIKLHGALTAWLTRREEMVRTMGHRTQLIHCDFNGKNILVQEQKGQWATAAVLDWEFACAGEPLVDLGNFFRFEEYMPSPFKTAFIQGYEAASGNLPQAWRQLAGILDVAAMMGFLISDQETPNSFRTARAICEKTLHLY